MSDKVNNGYKLIQITKLQSVLKLAVLALFVYYNFIGYIIPGFYRICKSTMSSMTLDDIGLIWVPVIALALVMLFLRTLLEAFNLELSPFHMDETIKDFKMFLWIYLLTVPSIFLLSVRINPFFEVAIIGVIAFFAVGMGIIICSVVVTVQKKTKI